jgi:hypothetical protein
MPAEHAEPHYVHDILLGHVPKPGFRGYGSANSSVTIDGAGLRFSGEMPNRLNAPILAVGDSYTYGEEVSDGDAWPAQLQRLTGRRVLNGGVSGYGFDQIVLRAEQLTASHRPSTVIVSFIADDVRRTEMRRMWWRDKPWFAIKDEKLTLQGVPVPNRTRLPLPIRHRMEQVLIELPPELQQLLGYHIRVHPAGSGSEISQRLVGRLARLQSRYRVEVIVLAQYGRQAWMGKAFADADRFLTRAMLERATSLGLATLDTFQRLATESRPRDFYGNSHMNARGNLSIATLVAARLSIRSI